MLTETIQYLYNLQFSGIKLGLENIENLLNFCKIDYRSLPIIHIAGTNGKGSTANILSQIYTEAGYKVGLFTSPHISLFNERIKIDGEMISDEKLSLIVESLREGIEKYNTTFFEANTAIALQYFINEKVDIVVFETGLGGRLDSTNIIDPILSIITTIGFDHQGYLGNSIVEIGREKGGIIKRGKPVVVNEKRGELKNLFNSIAGKMGSKIIYSSTRKIRVTKCGELSFNYKGRPFKGPFNLDGRYQRENLKGVITALELLDERFPVDREQLGRGLSKLYVKGRMEKISNEPSIILDAAHNEQGLNNLKREIKSLNYNKVLVITGVLQDKDYGRIISILSDIGDQISIFPPFNQRALDITKLQSYISGNGYQQFDICKNSREAFENTLKRYTSGDLILVTGSHFVLCDFLDHYNSL